MSLLCNCSCTHALLWSDFWTFFFSLPTFLKPAGVEQAAGSRNCERPQGVRELLPSGADRCDDISCRLCEWNATADTDTTVVLLPVTSSRATNQELSKCISRERRRLLRCLVKSLQVTGGGQSAESAPVSFVWNYLYSLYPCVSHTVTPHNKTVSVSFLRDTSSRWTTLHCSPSFSHLSCPVTRDEKVKGEAAHFRSRRLQYPQKDSN